MKMNGTVDLRLLSASIPDFNVAGHADINASFEGTVDRPRIIGRVKLINASARTADFPTGLSNVKGDLVFDAEARLFFDNVTGDSGGGILALSGSVNYSEKPYATTSPRKRSASGFVIRKGSAGWRADRCGFPAPLMAEYFPANCHAAREPERGPGIGRNSGFQHGRKHSQHFELPTQLLIDVEASSTPDARMEWPGAQLEADANLRIRGTAEHPILLGHIHVLSGDLFLRDNHYHVSRGDLNFANPFRLNPVINVGATTTIQQYEITLNFTGEASKLSLSYRSDPPLPANDIITLLALGQTSSESTIRTGGTTQSSNNSGATALLSEAISSQLGGRVEKLFGITRFRVDPGLTGVGASSSGQNAAARVTVEQQVTHNLTVLYETNVTSTQQQVIQIEYNVNRNISVVGLRDQNGTFGMDIKFKKRLP